MEQNYLQNYVIFDIDSSSVGALVFSKKYNKKTKKYIYSEVFSTRKKITKGQKVDFETFFNRTIKTFESVADDSYKHAGRDITDVFVNVASPWSSSQKREIHYEKNNEFVFTKDLADSIIEKELKHSLHKTHDFKGHNGLKLIERRTVDVFANGYPTKKPYGVSVKDVDIHSLVTVISDLTFKTFSHVIEKTFHKEPQFFSNVFMNYQSLLEIFPNENNITSIDISGEITEINIIINDHIKKIGTISVGSNGIIRYLAESLDIPFSKAESLISMYHENILEEKYKLSIESAMKESFLYWFKNLYNFLNEVSSEYIIPENFSLISQFKIQNWLNEWILKTEELGQHIHLGRTIRLLDKKMKFRSMNLEYLAEIKDERLAECLYFAGKHLIKNEQ